MRYSQIRDMDISNGVGIACSIYFQGCTHHCKGCFNPETWDFDKGNNLTKEQQDSFIQMCKKPYISCISLLGGEPFDQDNEELYNFLKRLKTEINKPVFVWTGYFFEDLLKKEVPNKILTNGLINVIIDGEFKLDERNLSLRLRGSNNQRVIDVAKSLKENSIIKYVD